MKFHLFLFTLAILFIGLLTAVAKADTFNVLDGKQLCTWYQDPNSCYNRTLKLIADHRDEGTFGSKNKSCDLSDRGQFTFEQSMDGMLKNPSSAPETMDFVRTDAGGRTLYEMTTAKGDLSSFAISGVDKSSRGTKALFTTINKSGTSIIYTARCDFYDRSAPTESIITWDAFHEAQQLCPQVLGKNPRPAPTVGFTYSQAGSKIQLIPFIQFLDKVPLFTCRNY